MQDGDLSNAIVPTWMVTLDVLLDGLMPKRRRLLNRWDELARRTPLSRVGIGALWLFTSRTQVRFECAVFGWPWEYCTALEDVLDRTGAHPIRCVTPYVSRDALASSLAFRPDLQAVVDLPEHVGRYGVRGVTTQVMARHG